MRIARMFTAQSAMQSKIMKRFRFITKMQTGYGIRCIPIRMVIWRISAIIVDFFAFLLTNYGMKMRVVLINS